MLFLSDQFPAERGCRHEDPVAPYLFVLCAEVLSTLIKQNNDLKVIVIHDMDKKKVNIRMIHLNLLMAHLIHYLQLMVL